MSDFSIRDILNRVDSGNLRIPSFQRGFVWDSDAIAFLMDSIYKGYPFGTIQLWRTKEKLSTEKRFGPFSLFDRDEEYPIDYILDGQQRITSIFGVFQTILEPNALEFNPFSIYFNLRSNGDSQDNQFVFIEEFKDEHKGLYFPLNCLFDSQKYRKETESLPTELIQKVDRLQEVFKEVKIPYQTLTTDDKSKVAIVFERINRQGVPLNTLQLLTAWTWSESFDLQDRFEDLGESLIPYGFGNLGNNSDLLLKIASSIITGKPTSDNLIGVNGNDVRAKFDEITNGIKGAIDFLKEQLNVVNIAYLPYEHQIIPLSVFFSNKGNKHFSYTDQQRKQLLVWFWRSAFSKRYSYRTNLNLEEDIAEIGKLKNNISNKLIDINSRIDEGIFLENNFLINAVYTKIFILMLMQNKPKSFITGSKVSLYEVLKDYNRKEFHHIYPKSFLQKEGYEQKQINCLANFCFLSRNDNQKISNKKPSEYRTEMPEDAKIIFDSAFIDEAIFISDDFDRFIKSRAEKLHRFAQTLID